MLDHRRASSAQVKACYAERTKFAIAVEVVYQTRGGCFRRIFPKPEQQRPALTRPHLQHLFQSLPRRRCAPIAIALSRNWAGSSGSVRYSMQFLDALQQCQFFYISGRDDLVSQGRRRRAWGPISVPNGQYFVSRSFKPLIKDHVSSASLMGPHFIKGARKCLNSM